MSLRTKLLKEPLIPVCLFSWRCDVYWRRRRWWWWWWYWYYSQTVRHEAGLCLLHSPCDHQGWTGEPCLVFLIRQSAQSARTDQHQAPPQRLQLSSLLAGLEGGWLSHDGGDGAGCQRIDWLCWSVVYSGSTSYTVHHTVHPTPPQSQRKEWNSLDCYERSDFRQ